MCDTILARPESTAAGAMLFGKNSDRQRNEAQAVEFFSSADHPAGTALACTYLTIPQVGHTYATLLCRPFWIWGAEMGVNEHQVVIGNEGLQARSPPPENNALTGMDLLRLALERSSDALQAVEVITSLLEQYGQGGNCGHLSPDYYNNGFIVADPTQAFVLETVGKEWLLERIAGVRAISNTYSIGRALERTSKGLPTLVRECGWSAEPQPHYAAALSDPYREHIGHAAIRRARATSLLVAREGHLTAAGMMRILRDHGAEAESDTAWHPARAPTRTLCAHAGTVDRRGQTVGSMVSELGKSTAVHWFTGTAAPCLSLFKPVLLDVPLPTTGPRPTDRFDSRTLWWRHEQLHRAALSNEFPRILDDIRQERDALEAEFQSRIAAVRDERNPAEKSRVLTRCWAEANETEARWLERLPKLTPMTCTEYRDTWDKMNRLAGWNR